MGAPYVPISGRRLNTDGTINVMCRVCERVISRELYRGFSTAICLKCQGLLEQGKSVEEILAATKKEEETQAADLYNDVGTFKVTGIGPRIKQVVAQVKQRAQARKRPPLFAEKDPKPVKKV